MNPVVRDYLLKKKRPQSPIPPSMDLAFAPPPPSSFDVSESSSPMATKGMLPTPPAPQVPKLTLEDITGPSLTDKLLNPPPPSEMAVEEPIAAAAPVASKPPETPVAVEPAPVDVAPKPTEPTKSDPMKGSLSVVAKALAGLADARNAGIERKSDYLGGIVTGERQAKADERAKVEFDRKEALEKEKDDPNSAYSRALQEVGKKVFPKGDFSKSTGRQLETTLQPYLKLFDIEKEAENRRATLEAAKLQRETAREERLGKQDEDRIQSIRKEVTGSKAYQSWLDIKNASDNLQNAMANPTGKRSLGALYSYVKALDPGSVVREGEISLAGEARSVAQRLEGTIRKWATGMVLTPAEITELATWAKEKEALARKTAVDSNKPAIEQARANKYDLSQINSDLFAADGGDGGDVTKTVRGKTYVKKNGQWYEQ